VTSPESFASSLDAARGGAEWALAALWRRYQPRLLAYLRAKEPAAAEDLAQETWIAVARGLVAFDGDESGFRAWLFTIARRRLLDHRRRRARRPETRLGAALLDRSRAGDDPARDALDAVGTDAAIARFAGLPPDQAEVLLRRVVADLDVAAVARLLGKQPGAVRVLAHRGLRRLACELAREAGRAEDDPATGVPIRGVTG